MRADLAKERWMRRWFPRALIAVSLFCLSACCTQRRSYSLPTGKDLLSALDRSDASLSSVRGKAKVDQFTPKGRIKVLVYLLATREGKLRFEAVSPFDTPLATLTSDGVRFTSIDHQNHRLYTGEAKPCNIARVLGMALQPGEVARALIGGAPRIAHDSVAVAWDRCLGADVLVLRDGKQGLEQRIHLRRLAADRYQVLRVIVRGGAGIVLDLRYEEFRNVSGHLLPRVVKFKQPAQKSDVIIRFSRQAANVSLPDSAFVIQDRGGLTEEELTCP
jgi:outer membrane lipoprotein-sorting protein